MERQYVLDGEGFIKMPHLGGESSINYDVCEPSKTTRARANSVRTPQKRYFSETNFMPNDEELKQYFAMQSIKAHDILFPFISLDPYCVWAEEDLQRLPHDKMMEILKSRKDLIFKMEGHLRDDDIAELAIHDPSILEHLRKISVRTIQRVLRQDFNNIKIIPKKLHKMIGADLLQEMWFNRRSHFNYLGKLTQETKYYLMINIPQCYHYLMKTNIIGHTTAAGALKKNYRVINYVGITNELMKKCADYGILEILRAIGPEIKNNSFRKIVKYVSDNEFRYMTFLLTKAPNDHTQDYILEEIEYKVLESPHLLKQINREDLPIRTWENLLRKNIMMAIYLPKDYRTLNVLLDKFPKAIKMMANYKIPVKFSIEVLGETFSGDIGLVLHKEHIRKNRNLGAIDGMIINGIEECFKSDKSRGKK